ncbi:MAG TPA: sterol desaturase family protein [Candidatus Sulfotelmatobacter sp.]|nr:sterol desaturase family protein [Candidatus Sulfotelmatobacter sp.]
MNPAVLTDRRATAVRLGLLRKRNNAITALMCGIPPALLLGFYSSVNGKHFAAGVLIGLIWANGFEYAYHRWLLHHRRNPLGTGHRDHHAQIGTDDEADYVSLASSPLNVFLLFAVNSVPALLISMLTGFWGILSGVYIGWMLYLTLTEEIHWRIHMGGWLPRGLGYARAYHMSHHDVPNSRYNIFLPIFDFLLGSSGKGAGLPPGSSATSRMHG